MKTTLEKAKENIHDNVVSSLQDLLERTYDAKAGYKKAMENAKGSHLIEFLKRRAAQRSQFANEIDLQIRKLNETPVASGSTKAAIHRSWMDLKAFTSSTTDEAVLEECLRGEKASLDTYYEILENQNFKPEITKMLNEQMVRVKSCIDEIGRLEHIENVMNA